MRWESRDINYISPSGYNILNRFIFMIDNLNRSVVFYADDAKTTHYDLLNTRPVGEIIARFRIDTAHSSIGKEVISVFNDSNYRFVF